MKKVYKCEFCDEVSEYEKQIIEHEKICGYNPKNKIDNEVIKKLSSIRNSFEDAIIYILLTDYKNDLEFFYDEYERATETNCIASIYEEKERIQYLISRAKNIEKQELKWFLDITKRDKPEFINAIRTYIEMPEFRIKEEK